MQSTQRFTMMPPDDDRSTRDETLGEMIANVVTHGVGAVFAVAGLVTLVALSILQEGHLLMLISVAIYGVTLVLLYLVSTIYHAARSRRWREVWSDLDHAAIFLLIAGTYTPFTLVSMGGGWGWSLFLAVWALAIAGVLLRLVVRVRSNRLLVPLYLTMGWLIVVAAEQLVTTLSWSGFVWIVAGGLLYTCGLVFFSWRRLPYNHAIWHLFVIGGSASHFFAVTQYVVLSGVA